MVRIALLAALSSACLNSSSVQCGERTCSSTAVCAPGDRCVAQNQIDACTGKADGESCNTAGIGIGVCDRTVCVVTGCGNGVVEMAELCDDNNRISLDGCSADCKSAEMCGDGYADPAIGEHCDLGAMNSEAAGATCRTDCKLARCGDDVVDPHEACDGGNTTPGDGCRADCTGRWTQMQSNTFAFLRAVWGSSKNDVYAVGEGRMVHYDGTTWSPVMLPITSNWFDVFGNGPSDVWVISEFTTNNVYHYDGASWTLQMPPVTSVFWRAGFARAGQVWLAGWLLNSPTEGRIAHWNGSMWTVTTVPAPLRDVWVSPAFDIWVTADNRAVYSTTTGTWAQVPNRSAFWVSGTSPTDITLFNDDGGSHYNGSAWTPMVGSDEIQSLRGVGGAAGEVFALGNSGEILICKAATCEISLASLSHPLLGVWGFAPGEAIIAGAAGTIFY